MRAAATYVFGAEVLNGRTVGVVGAGKVGGRLVDLLTAAGAQVVVTDPSQAALDAVLARNPGVTVAQDLDALLSYDLDVLSPNALGGLITAEVGQATSARVICGGANNQLAEPAVADVLAARGIVFAPDFMVNCGGVIQVAEELVGGDLDKARARTEQVYATTRRVLQRAKAEGVTPVTAAEQEAEDRILRHRAATEQVV